MTTRTQADIDRINAAEAKIAYAIQAVKAAVDQLNAQTRDFCGAAGSNEKNGDLQQQSQADQENKNKQYAETNDVAEKDHEAARSAAGQYSETEGGNAAVLREGLGHLVGFA
jgi:MoxR-like ATPase